MKISVLIDFDETVTLQNVAHYLFTRFAPAPATRYSKMYRQGKITFREYQEKTFDELAQPVEVIQRAVRENIGIRPGFGELVDAVERAGGTLTVVSAGMDFYIDPVLDSAGYGHVPRVCAKGRRNGAETGPFRYDYPPGSDTCRGDWAVCKCDAIAGAPDGAVTVFVGDGATSDACAASRADHVFARGRLLRHCRENGVPAKRFEDLRTVSEFIDGLSAGAGSLTK